MSSPPPVGHPQAFEAVGAPSASAPSAPRVQTQYSRSGWPLDVKIRRALWTPFHLLFLRGTGRYLSPLRVMALRLFGARIRGPVLVMDGVKVWHPWSLRMEPHSTLGRGVEVYNFADVVIGEQATVSQDTYLCTASHDHEHPYMPLVYRPIDVGPQSWIAARCFVGPGVRVHEGAVLAACTVAVKDVPAWTVVGGNPARPLRHRRLRAAE